MRFLADTSVWSLAVRRDVPPDLPEVDILRQALLDGGKTVTTGLILQELLQGLAGARDRTRIIELFRALPTIAPSRDDHVAAAELRNQCRRAGVQVGTVDALVARLCIANDLVLLATDLDFIHVSKHTPLRVWKRPAN